MEHLKCNLFCIVKHLSGIAATSLTLILPLDSTRRATPRAQPLDPARLSCPDCGLQGTQETQWKYLKLAENARSTVPIKSMPFWVALPLSLSLSRSISLFVYIRLSRANIFASHLPYLHQFPCSCAKHFCLCLWLGSCFARRCCCPAHAHNSNKPPLFAGV